jgi:hypothetical protein
MVAVTVVAVVLGLGAALGPVFGVVWYIVVYFIRCILPTPLVICAIFGRGRVRAFAIGAIIPWVADFVWSGQQQSLLFLAMTILNSAACGFVAVATYGWIGPSLDD